jgi:hypothetical protein
LQNLSQDSRRPDRDSNQDHQKTSQEPYHFSQLSLFETCSSSKYPIIQFLPHINERVTITEISHLMSFRENIDIYCEIRMKQMYFLGNVFFSH